MFDFKFGDFFNIFKLLFKVVGFVMKSVAKLFGTLERMGWVFTPYVFLIAFLSFEIPIIEAANKPDVSDSKKFGLYALAVVVFIGLILLIRFLHYKFEVPQKDNKKIAKNTKTRKGLTLIIHISILAVLCWIFQIINMKNKPDEVSTPEVSPLGMSLVIMVICLVIVSTAFILMNKYVTKQTGNVKNPNNSKVKVSNYTKAESSLSLPIESYEPHGVFFGRKRNHYIIKPEELDGHVLVVGGVGTGKSSCVAIPTLRNWEESVFAIDIKGELYEKTKNQRKKIKVFSPLDENSYGYDPFFCFRNSDNQAQEARAIALALIPLPLDTKEPFWIENAQNIFTAAILHYSAQGSNFLDTIKEIQKRTPKSLIKELCDSSVIEARYFVNSMAEMDDRTLASIMSELSKNIVCFITDKNLISALSRKQNITPLILEFGSDVYINIPEHLLRQWKDLLTLIVNQFLTFFEQRTEVDTRPILFLLDEFPRLGKINSMLDGLATLRSKKIVMCLIIQSLSQLDAIYGQNERKIIADTCAYKAILGATDADTQEYFSRLVGTYDKLITTHGTNNEAFTGFSKGTSTNTQEQEKRIIKPHEFGNLKDIVLLAPFDIPFDRPKEENRKSAEQEFYDSIIRKDVWEQLLNGKKEVETVGFCRVEKVPYYLTDEEQNANL